MGDVIFFRSKTRRLPVQEQMLLGRLTGSLQVVWRGGWAVPSARVGGDLLQHGQSIGVWRRMGPGFMYWPVAKRQPEAQFWCLEGAHQHSLDVLGVLAYELTGF